MNGTYECPQDHMKEVFVIRHAEAPYDPAVHDAERRLSANGRHQAVELAKLAEPLGIEEIHTSPYRRCLHTIAPLAERLSRKPTEVHDLRERFFTRGHVLDWADTWKTAWMNPDFAFPDGETGRDAQARMYRAVTRIVTTTSARTLAISSHGNVIALLLKRIHASFTLEQASAIRNPDVLRLTFDGDALRWDSAFELSGLARISSMFPSNQSVR